ncbi:hypothetical protein L211DRAFT_883136 [Terfezia boudieri ATCC MYA-4762]|uniref:Uncharacterized protein n=1 Tax=Terfezia boudieri ATCC MYA-4762 TaxID=1051890 RepID=A0A3N4LKU5_9PEZI|nr:hypothetical protein L211DRAFT_883136 [Terfezia boudieri ATCC MYA-4762]
MLSNRIQGLLTLLAVAIAIVSWSASANANRAIDPPEHHAASAQTCPVFGPGSSRDINVEIQNIHFGLALMKMNVTMIQGGYPSDQSSIVRIPSFDTQAERLEHTEQTLDKMEGGLSEILQKWQNQIEVSLVNAAERLHALESSNQTVNNKLQTLQSNLDDKSRCCRQDGEGSEGKVGVEEGRKGSIELKGKDLTATVSGVPVLGFIIGLWATVLSYFLYTNEWLARRERRWRLRDERRKKVESKETQVEDGRLRCGVM